ncbi:MAG: DUF4012 domain-containing protein [Chloroflexota bacterium]
MKLKRLLQNNKFKRAALFILALIILWLGSLAYYTIHLRQTLKEIKDVVTQDEIFDLDPAIIGSALSVTARDVTILQTLMYPTFPFLKAVALLPGIGPYAAQVQPLLQYGAGLAQAGNLAYTTLSPLPEYTPPNTQNTDLPQQIYHTLLNGQSSLTKATQAIDKAGRARPDIEPTLLPYEYEQWFFQIDKYFDLIQQGLHLLAVMPELLGSPNQPNAYLILAQNRDELRASGGFISGIGLVKVAGGKLVSLDIGDSYVVDDYSKGYPPPPDPLRQFMMAGYWVPRDANWSPDFPTAAQTVQELYTLSTDQQTDGVIAFDQVLVKTLINILGPLHLPDFSEPVTADNIETIMQQSWAPAQDEKLSQEWWEHRKDFMPQLGKALIEQLLNTREKQILVQLARELLSSVKSGHLLLYFNNPNAQAALVQAGLDNGLHPEDGDFILVVDSNIGFNKTDAVVNRSVTYQVDMTNPQMLLATLILRYTHTISEDVPCDHEASYGSGVYTDMQKRCYWDYWRVYLPRDTNLIYATEFPIPGEWLLSGQDWSGEIVVETGENDTLVVSSLLVLPTAQSQEITLQLAPTSSHVLNSNSKGTYSYHLRVQKQAGLKDVSFSLELRLLTGYQINNTDEAWKYNADSGFWVWTGRITSTVDFEVDLVPSNSTPSH